MRFDLINDWENPAVQGLHREPAHAILTPYANEAQALWPNAGWATPVADQACCPLTC